MKTINLDESSREEIYLFHRETTRAALIQVFGKSEQEATESVHELWSRYRYAPQSERDLLLHNDPVALACDLAKEEWRNVNQDRLREFNLVRRSGLESMARRF